METNEQLERSWAIVRAAVVLGDPELYRHEETYEGTPPAATGLRGIFGQLDPAGQVREEYNDYGTSLIQVAQYLVEGAGRYVKK